MEVKKTNFVRILEEICREEGIRLDSFSYNWGHRLTKDGKSRFIVGYQFQLNAASVRDICQDKVLTYGVLHDQGVPAAVHLFLPKEGVPTGIAPEDNRAIAEFFLRKDGEFVLKDNYGTGGSKVYRIRDMETFDAVLEELYKSSYAAALCPFYKIADEYRAVVLDGEIRVVIRKDRQKVVGDGQKSVRALIGDDPAKQRYLRSLTEEQLETVPEEGETYYLTWKHNLGQGAYGVILKPDEVPEEVRRIALSALQAIPARFCSVDVIRTDEGFMVLEINAGVMMEHLSGEDPEYYEIAKGIYKDAVLRMLEETR